MSITSVAVEQEISSITDLHLLFLSNKDNCEVSYSNLVRYSTSYFTRIFEKFVVISLTLLIICLSFFHLKPHTFCCYLACLLKYRIIFFHIVGKLLSCGFSFFLKSSPRVLLFANSSGDINEGIMWHVCELVFLYKKRMCLQSPKPIFLFE